MHQKVIHYLIHTSWQVLGVEVGKEGLHFIRDSCANKVFIFKTFKHSRQNFHLRWSSIGRTSEADYCFVFGRLKKACFERQESKIDSVLRKQNWQISSFTKSDMMELKTQCSLRRLIFLTQKECPQASLVFPIELCSSPLCRSSSVPTSPLIVLIAFTTLLAPSLCWDD